MQFSLPSWQTIRDLLIAAALVAATAGLDYLTLAVQSHPLGSAALTAFVLAALGILRRALNPTVTVAQAQWEFAGPANIHVASDAPPKIVGLPKGVGLDFDTPEFNLSPKSNDAFLYECASQIQAYTPRDDDGTVKTFDPATIIAILSWVAKWEGSGLISRRRAGSTPAPANGT